MHRPTALLAPILYLLVLLAGLACTPTIHVHTDTPDMSAMIRDAGRTLGVRAVEAPSGSGVVEVEFRPVEGDTCGQALERVVGSADSPRDLLTSPLINCQPQAWSCASSRFLAHELGHTLGLQHRPGEIGDDPEDPKRQELMHPAPLGDHLSKWERRLAQAVAIGFAEACRPAQPTGAP